MPALQLPEGHLVHVATDNFVIGRDAGCDLRLYDDKVSPRHVIVQRVDGEWQVALLDLDATARLNNEPVTGISKLHDGDILEVGDTRLRWVEGEAMPPPPARRSPWLLALLVVTLVLLLAALILTWTSRGRQAWVGPPATSPAATATPRPALALTSAPSETPSEATVAPVHLPLVGTAGEQTPTASPVAGASATPVFFPLVGSSETITPTMDAGAAVTPILLPLVKSGEEATLAPTPKTATPSPDEATPTISPDAGMVSTPPASADATSGLTQSPAACPPPAGWTRIVVQEGENLLDIALRYRISRARLARGNCLLGYALEPGQVLYVPRTD